MLSKASRSASRRAVRGKRRRIARAVSDLPEPLSPTMPSFSWPSVSDTPRTASLTPVGVGEGDAQARHLHQGRAHRCLGSRMSRSPSPSRLNAKAATKIAMPGIVGTHHCSRM